MAARGPPTHQWRPAERRGQGEERGLQACQPCDRQGINKPQAARWAWEERAGRGGPEADWGLRACLLPVTRMSGRDVNSSEGHAHQTFAVCKTPRTLVGNCAKLQDSTTHGPYSPPRFWALSMHRTSKPNWWQLNHKQESNPRTKRALLALIALVYFQNSAVAFILIWEKVSTKHQQQRSNTLRGKGISHKVKQWRSSITNKYSPVQGLTGDSLLYPRSSSAILRYHDLKSIRISWIFLDISKYLD